MTTPDVVGVVVGHFGLDVEVQLDDGERRRVRVRRDGAALVVGDRVRLSEQGALMLPRRSVLARRDARDRTRPIAANLDALGVTIAAHPPAPRGFVDRAVVAARAAGIDPFLVVNKCDEEASRRLATRVRATWGGDAAALRVFAVSASSGAGLDRLRAFLAGEGPEAPRRAAFVGTSGVGKSSLVNALVPGLALEVGEINRFTRLGRHVTTRGTLHALPLGGELIDTPGFRDFVPVDVAPAELARHFPGFEVALADGCRFRDCLHRDEPGCAVTAAVAAGGIPPERHRVYLELLADLERAAASDRVRRS